MQPQNPQFRAVLVTLALIALVCIIVFGVYFYSTKNTSTPSVGMVSNVKLFYIALEDGGKSGKPIGCGDSVVPVSISITPTQAPLQASLEKLFAEKSESVGQSGLRNALAASQLKVDSATVQHGVATVKLSGSVSLGGVCDDPRFVSQIKETVLQFPSITSAIITINNKTLESYASEK